MRKELDPIIGGFKALAGVLDKNVKHRLIYGIRLAFLDYHFYESLSSLLCLFRHEQEKSWLSFGEELKTLSSLESGEFCKESFKTSWYL